MKKDVIAMVGAGEGGSKILATLLKIPGITIKYVNDINPDAPGIALAKLHDIQCSLDPEFPEIAADPDLDLIFEVTGDSAVLKKLNQIKGQDTILIGASGTKVIFHLLEAKDRLTQKLEEYKQDLELRIVERTEELEWANHQLEGKVREYERLNEKLEQLTQDKTKYLLQATHQLKAPFAAIQSYADIIIDGYTGAIPAKTMDIMKKIRARCEMLSTSIREMLDLANLKSLGRESLRTVPVSLNEVAGEVVNEAVVLAEQKNIALKFTPLDNNPEIRCSREQIKILFAVLVENAVNYSQEATSIEVAISREEPGWLKVAVADHGIGIAEPNLERIFTEYFRSNEAVKQHANGTGLGLAIAKRIVDIHNFNLQVSSRLGEGTTFTVLIPFKPHKKPAS